MSDFDLLYNILSIYKDNINKPRLSNITFLTGNCFKVVFHLYIKSENDMSLVEISTYIKDNIIDWKELNNKLGWKVINEQF